MRGNITEKQCEIARLKYKVIEDTLDILMREMNA